VTEPLEYEAIFNHRGNAYAEAMERYPHARDEEFRGLFRHVDLAAVRTVADVPSGSGYLATWLPPGVALDAYDPTVAFRSHGTDVHPVSLEAPVLARHDYDLVVCLAALHHVADKAGFFAAVAEHVRPGGQVVLADIAASSKLVPFLDGFIGAHNGTGHQGMYFNPADPFDFGRDHPRLAAVEVATLPCPWRFPDRAAMTEFSALLFGAASAGAAATERAIERHVGIRATPAGAEMAWELTYITATLA
jgi:SAM-dependent methyltransferase